MKHKIKFGMINLVRAPVTFMHKNDRVEKHGDDDVLACDLKLRLEFSNEILDLFSPSLRESIYTADEKSSSKKGADLPGMDAPLTVIKNPQIETYKWHGLDIVGGTFVIHGAISGNDIEFDDAGVNKWTIEPKQGGTVNIVFRVQIHPEKKSQRGHLMDLLEIGKMTISVIPPEPSKDLVDDTDKKKPAAIDGTVKGSDAPKTKEGMTLN